MGAEYVALAAYYDMLTEDVDYAAYAAFALGILTEERQVKSILDLACGTGTLSYLLAEEGFEMISVDASADMLAQAMQKSVTQGVPPLFLCQEMETLDLYGTVDACVCLLDSINHVDPEALQTVFARVSLFLAPSGRFLFDVLLPSHLESLDGELCQDEREGLFCVWQSFFEKEVGALRYDMDFFIQSGTLWRRELQSHREWAHSLATLKTALQMAGFVNIMQHTDPVATGKATRIFFSAEKRG